MLEPTEILLLEKEPEAFCCMPEIWHEGIGGNKAFWKCVTRLQEAKQHSVLGTLSFRIHPWRELPSDLERARWCHPAGELEKKKMRSERHGFSTTVVLSLLLFCISKNFWSNFKKELHHSHPWQSMKCTSHSGTQGSRLRWKVIHRVTHPHLLPLKKQAKHPVYIPAAFYSGLNAIEIQTWYYKDNFLAQ